MEYEDDYRSGPDIEPDSDAEDVESESQLSQWLGELENYAKGLEPGDTGTVRRRQKTVVTPKMAMESFRYSFMSENQDVNFDAILGELCELETQLGAAQSELPYYNNNNRQCSNSGLLKDEHRDSGNDIAQAELDALANEISCSLGLKHNRPMGELDYFRTHYPGDLGGYSDAMLDIAETDSAFSESASLPSSESFTSMVTMSSTAAEMPGMSDTGSIGSGATITPHAFQCDSASCPCMRFANPSANQCRQEMISTNQCRPDMITTNQCRPDMISTNQCRPDMISTNQCRPDMISTNQCRPDMISTNKCRPEMVLTNQCRQENISANQGARQEIHSTNHRSGQEMWQMNNHHYHHVQAPVPFVHEEQRAKIKAEKIRIALEKIKEAKIKKLFVRAFACDGSSKSIMVDEKMTILEVIATLADKNHVRLNPDLAVIEHMPELYMERVLEDHDSLVENMAMWTRDTKNQIMFESRPQKNALFKCPERYLLVPSSSEKGASLDPKRRENLIQEFFSGSASQVPEVEGVLYLKSEGKKAWKKYFFVLRASGLYYNPKGKISKSPKDLSCLVQFEFVDLYTGINWKKKFHSPTDFCFALKHPQIQKKTSKFIRYLCCENKAALDQWIMGIRIAKFGKQLLTNFQNLEREILSWDLSDVHHSISDQSEVSEAVADLNQAGDLTDSRMSMPTPGSRHSIVNVQNPMLVREPSQGGNKPDEILCLEIDKFESCTKTPERKSSIPGLGVQISDPVKLEKVPVKRVSFSNTHSVINDAGEEVLPVRHRDSITSASTDSSEDSTSSGEGRLGGMSHRSSKLRAKLPVTTGTTKQISEMVQTSLDGSTGSMDGSVEDWKPSGMCSNNNNNSQLQKDLAERRKSAPACGDAYSDRKSDMHVKDQRSMSQTQCHYDPMSPSSPGPNSPFQYKGSRGVMTPSPQKGVRSHSRGSSVSSVDSSDSYQGYVTSPITESPYQDPGQPSWIQYDESLGNFPLPKGQGQLGMSVKQGPPTAQKPVGVKKNRPQSGPATGPVEKGHKRNTSKSSLESVEETNEGQGHSQIHRGPIPISSPHPPRSVSATPPVGLNHSRSASQSSQPSSPAVGVSVSAPTYPSIPMPHPQETHPSTAGPHMTPAQSQPPFGPHFQQPETPRVSQAVPSSPVPAIGCMSPRLSTHKVSGPKPVAPPTVPCLPPTPPALVPPTPRNPATSVKTHKKRPSGGNIVVNGNDAASLQQSGICPDIVTSPRILQSGTNLESTSQGHGAITDENCYEQLPFMAELNKHMHKASSQQSANIYDTLQSLQNADMPKTPPLTLPKPTDQRPNGNTNLCQKDFASYHSTDNTYQTVSTESAINRSSASSSSSSLSSLGSQQQQQQQQQPSSKRQLPPPPPRRSQSTKLSSSSTTSSSLNASQSNTIPVETNVPNLADTAGFVSDPIYDNCEGIVDISDLPPPPPELLEDFQGQGDCFQGQGHIVQNFSRDLEPQGHDTKSEGQKVSKVKPPPPPPKRNRETQLSMS